MNDVYIGFRASDWEHLEGFLQSVRRLKVEKTTLMKRAIEIGLDQATKEIEAENKEAEQRAKRVNQLMKAARPFNWPLTPSSSNALVVC